jgi:hypothetical protein
MPAPSLIVACCAYLLLPADRSSDALDADDKAPAKAVQYFDLLSSARRAAAAGQHRNAVELYRKALAINADDGTVHRLLGHALYALQNFGEAATEYELARAHGFLEAADGAYRIAACYALAGEADLAFRWLESALRSRLKNRSQIAEDPRFERLRGDPRFAECVAALPRGIAGREAGWKHDLGFLASEIRRLHPSYAKELPRAFEERLRALERQVNSLTDRRIAIEIMALLASLGDAHSVMMPFGMKRGTLSRLPVQLYAFSDGIFVIDAPDSQREWIGSKVLEIGGREVDKLGVSIRPYLSRDNDQFLRFAVPFGLTMPDLLGAVGARVDGGQVKLRLLRDGRTSVVPIEGVEGPLDSEKLPLKLIPPKNRSSPPPDYLAHLAENFWLKSADSSSLYVQMNQCQDAEGKTLVQFAAAIAGKVKESRPRNLILDLRLNNGGNYEAMFPIAKSLINFQASRPDARLFVIIGRNTLSAAQNFIGLLDDVCEPIFVGEPSGSKPNHAGDDTLVTLPYSGIMASISCAYHQTNFRDGREWIAPGIPVGLSSEEYLGQRDPAIEAITSFIAKH